MIVNINTLTTSLSCPYLFLATSVIGDAFLVQWVQEVDARQSIEKAAIKAYECATALQTHQCLQQRNLDGTLKIKIGINNYV